MEELLERLVFCSSDQQKMQLFHGGEGNFNIRQ